MFLNRSLHSTFEVPRAPWSSHVTPKSLSRTASPTASTQASSSSPQGNPVPLFTRPPFTLSATTPSHKAPLSPLERNPNCLFPVSRCAKGVSPSFVRALPPVRNALSINLTPSRPPFQPVVSSTPGVPVDSPCPPPLVRLTRKPSSDMSPSQPTRSSLQLSRDSMSLTRITSDGHTLESKERWYSAMISWGGHFG